MTWCVCVCECAMCVLWISVAASGIKAIHSFIHSFILPLNNMDSSAHRRLPLALGTTAEVSPG